MLAELWFGLVTEAAKCPEDALIVDFNGHA